MESFSLVRKQRRLHAVTIAGFTLLEMIVALTIISILTAVILNGQNSFNRTLLLTDTAYTVALSIRQTQSLGLSSKQYGSGGSLVKNAGYGIHFANGTTDSYIQFADIQNTAALAPGCTVGTVGYPDQKPGNCVYDGAGEQVQKYTFSRGFTIASFCAYSGSTTLGCSGGGLLSLDISFQRPNTSSVITAVLPGGTELAADSACVKLQDATGQGVKYIKVTQLGQVSVVASCP